MKMEENICPICGYGGLERPAYDEHGYGSQETCPCCGIDFGYEDWVDNKKDLPERWENLRKRWKDAGAKWLIPKMKPKGWKSQEQLKNTDRAIAHYLELFN